MSTQGQAWAWLLSAALVTNSLAGNISAGSDAAGFPERAAPTAGPSEPRPLVNRSNALPSEARSPDGLAEQFKAQLELARHFRHIRLAQQAEPILVELLGGNAP